jgi:hypothetical protein
MIIKINRQAHQIGADAEVAPRKLMSMEAE